MLAGNVLMRGARRLVNLKKKKKSLDFNYAVFIWLRLTPAAAE